MFWRFTSKQTYRMFLFLYILCTIHHSLRCWNLLFKVKSGSRKISILLFSRIFVYRCLGNIDFHKRQTTLKFNPKPASIANFTLIRKDEDCLRADFKSEVWSKKRTVLKHLTEGRPRSSYHFCHLPLRRTPSPGNT